jgi:putative PIN family toxin of toxin-antitoxin system
LEARQKFLESLSDALEPVSVHTHLQFCRHSKDDKFLELAIDGRADVIITGDKDLLVLHPFRGIAILSPADYLAG